MKDKYNIKIHCLFCKSDHFELPEENYHPKLGEMIKCANCGRLNSYEAMYNVAKEKGLEEIQGEVEKELKKAFKGFKIL